MPQTPELIPHVWHVRPPLVRMTSGVTASWHERTTEDLVRDRMALAGLRTALDGGGSRTRRPGRGHRTRRDRVARRLGDRYGDAVLPAGARRHRPRRGVRLLCGAAVDRFGSARTSWSTTPGTGTSVAVRGAHRGRGPRRSWTRTSSARSGSPRRCCRSCARSIRGTSSQVTSEGGVARLPGHRRLSRLQVGARGACRTPWPRRWPSTASGSPASSPGRTRTGWLDVGARHSPPHPAYQGLHDRAPAFETGDPGATKAAILQIVDTDDPPLRVLLGRGHEAVRGVYERRLAEWDRWQDLSLDAFGAA